MDRGLQAARAWHLLPAERRREWRYRNRDRCGRADADAGGNRATRVPATPALVPTRRTCAFAVAHFSSCTAIALVIYRGCVLYCDIIYGEPARLAELTSRE